MTTKQFATPAALALLIAIGMPAHAGGNTTVVCNPAPVKCDPTPVKCNPVPECGPKGAVPEPASVALVGIGSLLLLPVAMRALKSRRQIN